MCSSNFVINFFIFQLILILYFIFFRTGKNHKLVVLATQKSNDPMSVFHARYPVWMPFDFAKLTVLDTDYDNYGIVVGVIPLIGKRYINLTRSIYWVIY